MAELKTKLNDGSVVDFLNSVQDEKRKTDAFAVLEILKEVTGEEPKMWGGSIIGFGTYQYKYPTGREGTWFKAGFSPRKNATTFYIMSGFDNRDKLMTKLGKYKTGKACLYVKKLEDIDEAVLRELISESIIYIDNHEFNHNHC